MIKRMLKRLIGPLLNRIARNNAYDLVAQNHDLKFFFDQTEGMINFEEGLLLYELAKQAKGECIVEVGAYRGRSSVMLGRGSLDGSHLPVYTIEPHEPFTGILGGAFGPPDRGAFYQAMLDTSCFHSVHLVNLSSELVTPNWNKKVGLLWIDGDHAYEGVKRDFECWRPHLTPDALIAFDDSTNPEIGPARLIAELLESGQFVKKQVVRNVTVLAQHHL